MIYTTLHCVRPTQSSVAQINHRNGDVKCFFLHVCLLLSLFIQISFIFYKVV